MSGAILTKKKRRQPEGIYVRPTLPTTAANNAQDRKEQRVSVRLPIGLLAAIDAWADAQEGPALGRGEAICRLLQAGLIVSRIDQLQGWPVTEKYVPCNALDGAAHRVWRRSQRLVLPERELQRVIQVLDLRASGHWSFIAVDDEPWLPATGHGAYVFLFEVGPDLELLKL